MGQTVRGELTSIARVDIAMKHGLLKGLSSQQPTGSVVSTLLACELVMLAVSLT